MKVTNPVLLFSAILWVILAQIALDPVQATAGVFDNPQIHIENAENADGVVIEPSGVITVEVCGDPDSAGDGLEMIDPNLLLILAGIVEDQGVLVGPWLFALVAQWIQFP